MEHLQLLRKYTNNVFLHDCIVYFRSGTVWLSNVNCHLLYSCLGSCSGGSCPSIKPNCATDVLSVNCSKFYM